MRLASLARADKRLHIALAAAFLWHGGLLISGSYRRTYDAYIHMFFGDHYAREWFSTWEPRWYTGFTVTSYPPGTHQLIGFLSKFLGLEAAFVVVQLTGILLLVLGVYRFSLIWVNKTAAGWAALLAVVSTSVAEVVHVFGQLPTTFSLALLLNTLPSVFAWVADARGRHLIVAIAGLAATTAAHHVTTLFGAVFFVGPVIATALLDRLRAPAKGEDRSIASLRLRGGVRAALARRTRRVLPALIRAGVIGMAAIAVLVTVVLPYWLWSSSDPIVQIPIPHATRDDFLENTAAGLVFFVVPWGLTIFALPVVLLRGAFSRALPLAASALLLFVLGTGGTTPIPRLILRGAFDILTLDRFTVWSTIAVLPLMGWLVPNLTSGKLASMGRALFGRRMWNAALIGTGMAVLASAVLAANFALLRPLQPDRIDPEPIAAFMNKDQHDRWRYLTLGFGDQMAIVSASMTAATVDGNYHSARRLPELTSRSVERLEGAKFRGIPGIGSLQQFLATPETYSLKFVFSNDSFYDPLLWASGWHRLERLDNGIVVWERADIAPLPDVLPTKELPPWQRLMWGTLPPAALASATLAFTWNFTGQRLPQPIERAITRHTPAVRRSLPMRLYGRLDRWLARRAGTARPGAPRRQRLAELQAWWATSTARLSEISTSQRRVLRGAVLGLAVIVLAVGAWRFRSVAAEPLPAEVVTAHYDHLDFRRFDQAWEQLDPAQRPTFDQFELELSVSDGLVASYSKLDRIETEVTEQTNDRARIAVSLTYITALTEYEQVREHALRFDGDQWWITPDPSDPSTTPDQFARSTEVTYLSQGRRQVTTEQTTFGDVLDRPRIATLSARAVEADDRWSVVGQITNLDVDPADITVTARFLNGRGELLVEHNASLVTIHKVLPRETVPFRVDLEAIAGATDPLAREAGEFHPDLFASPQLEIAEVAEIELIAKAVVTGRDLGRSLVPQNLRIAGDGGLRLEGDLRNSGTKTATVPHMLLTWLDDDGSVLWVDDEWIPASVRPQRVDWFSVPLELPGGLRTLDVPITIYGNGIARSEGAPFASGATLAAPPSVVIAEEWAQLGVSVHSFERNAS